MYQNDEGNVVAQIALRTNAPGTHNGLKCYLARGLPLQRQFLEHVAAADSAGDFNIAFVGDESLTGTGEKYLPLSVILQSTERSSDKWNEEHALQQFRELMSNFKLLPLRNAYPPSGPISASLGTPR